LIIIEQKAQKLNFKLNLRNFIYINWIIFLLFNNYLKSETYWVRHGWQLFKSSGDARILSLGGAASTDFGTTISPLFNPASSINLAVQNLSYTHQNRFAGIINSDLIGFVNKSDEKGINLIIMHESIDKIPDTRKLLLDYGYDGIPGTGDIGENNGILDDGERLDNEKIKYINQNQLGIHLSTAWLINRINIGLALKILNHSIGNKHGHGIGFDIGMLMDTWKNGNIALVIKDFTTSWHVWDSGNIERSKPLIVFGLSHSIDFDKYPLIIKGLADISFNANGKAINDDFNFGKLGGNINTGVNIIYDYKLALRVGRNIFGSISAGIGLSWDSISLDYALIPEPNQSNFGSTSMISLTVDTDWLQKLVKISKP